jgi:hypothetical protein
LGKAVIHGSQLSCENEGAHEGTDEDDPVHGELPSRYRRSETSACAKACYAVLSLLTPTQLVEAQGH